MAWGPGGVGKTRGFEQASKELNINSRIIQGPLQQPTDILGLPDKKNDKYTTWLRPETLPDEGEGIILIDELPDSSLLMQKAYYQWILDNRVQNHIIPSSWWTMGAGNRAEDKAMSSNMPAPLITRFCHVGVCCTCPDFTKYTVESAEMDDSFITHCIKHFHPLVSAFLKFQPKYMYRYQAVPRTWEYISILLRSESDYFSFEFKELIKGTIGSDAGTKFNSFVAVAAKIPSIDAIITNPYSVDIPLEIPIVYATITALIHKTKRETIDNIITFIERVGIEFQTFYFISIREKFPEAMANEKYIKWMNKNKDYIL